MMQFYFLSITANILAGLALTADYLGEKFKAFSPFKELFGKRGFKIGAGASALIIGFMKLLIRSSAGDVPVVGDLLPALAGLGMGAALLFDLYKEKATVKSETLGSLEKAVVTYKVPLGLSGLAVGVLHFFLPWALFL